jgi:uncharacterized membrane protein YraQ (UPF0718 family)
MVALLIAGTLKLWPLTATVTTVQLPLGWALDWQNTLFSWVPYDAAKGEEGVTFQGSVLIALLLMIAATAWKGLENIIEGANRWTATTLALATATLLVAALRLTPNGAGLEVAITGRLFGVALCLWAVAHYAMKLEVDDRQAWLWESWRFVKQIFGLLVIGVFIVGVVRQIIRPEWIESLAGTNSVWANITAVFFGVFMYFPTLVEVPVAKMFLDLGMHPGPLLAYLMADPELSLQSMLMVIAVIGRKKTFTYVSLVALFSVISGMTYGAWVDGVSALILAMGLGIAAVFFGLLLKTLSKRNV